MICWIDTETTGLSPARDVLLEVACIITDDHLREIERYHRVIYWQGARASATGQGPSTVDPYVVEMHTDNGLWLDSANFGDQPATVERSLAAFIEQHTHIIEGKPRKMILAGSTISFDRAFLQAHMPDVAEMLHYRNLDVTSINELVSRFWPEVHAARPPQSKDVAHRAMPDIEHSLEVARYYAKALGPVVS